MFIPYSVSIETSLLIHEDPDEVATGFKTEYGYLLLQKFPGYLWVMNSNSMGIWLCAVCSSEYCWWTSSDVTQLPFFRTWRQQCSSSPPPHPPTLQEELQPIPKKEGQIAILTPPSLLLLLKRDTLHGLLNIHKQVRGGGGKCTTWFLIVTVETP